MSRKNVKETVTRIQVQALTSKQSAKAPTEVNFAKKQVISMLMTPELATWILENKNKHNLRKTIYQSHIEYLSAIMMATDEWIDNHPQPIIFDSDGELIDGQHRLMSIVNTGKSFWMKVECGQDKKVSKTLDGGKARVLRDHISFSEDPTANKFISQVVKQYHYMTVSQVRGQPLSAYEQTYLEHSAGIDFAAAFVATRHKGVTRVGVACALVEMYALSATRARLFADSLKIVDGPVQQARMLRDWCLHNLSVAQGSTGQNMWYSKAVYCMNASLLSREITRVQPGTWTYVAGK